MWFTLEYDYVHNCCGFCYDQKMITILYNTGGAPSSIYKHKNLGNAEVTRNYQDPTTMWTNPPLESGPSVQCQYLLGSKRPNDDMDIYQ